MKNKETLNYVTAIINFIAGLIKLISPNTFKDIHILNNNYLFWTLFIGILFLNLFLQWEVIKKKVAKPLGNYFSKLNITISTLSIITFLLLSYIIIFSVNKEIVNNISIIATFNSIILLILILIVFFILIQFKDLFTKSVSTSYFGIFPEDMGELVKFISETKNELKILVDFPSYGCYSNPSAYEKYKNTLVELASKNKKITLNCYNSTKSREQTLKEFENFEEIEKSKVFEQFYSIYAGKKKADRIENFVEHLISIDDEFLQYVNLRNIRTNLINETLRIYIWIRDSEKAVFSFHNYATDAHDEVYFITSESRLIEIFISLIDDINKSNKLT